MKLLGYSQFTKDFRINENLDGAKKVLRDTYQTFKSVKSVTNDYDIDPSGLFLFNKEGDNLRFEDLPEDIQNAAKSKFRENALTPEEKQKAERSNILKAVRDILGDKNLGWAYMFTYLMLIEKTPIDELESIFAKLQEYRDLLNAKNPSDNKPLLRRPIANYIDPSVPNNAENIVDDLENISLYKAVKKVYNEFTPKLKTDYASQPPVIKKQVDDIALAFSQLGIEGGKINLETQEKLWKLFFGELKVLNVDMMIRGKSYKAGDKIYTGQMFRYETVRDFIRSAQNYLKNIGNNETVKFYEQIEKCNEKYGDYGVKVMFDESNILILEIMSFQSNQMMNGHTRHCIKDSLNQWNYYVGGEDKNTRQYYIYNFNLPSYDTKSVIGITIGPDQRVTACHLKDDGSFGSNIKRQLKDWESEYGITEDLFSKLEPMSRELIEMKRRRVLANREIVKKGKTLSELKKLLTEDGADVNSGEGAALHYSVQEGDIEKVKYLLEFGASPNLRKKNEATVNRIEEIEDSTLAFDILKLLISYGAELSRTVFKTLIGDINAVKFCLDNGLDPNFQNGIGIRLALKKGLYNVVTSLYEAGAKIDESGSGLNLAWAYESGSKECVDWVLKNNLTPDILVQSMGWLGHSTFLPAKRRLEILKELQEMIDRGEIKPKSTGYRLFNKDGRLVKRDGTYKDMVDLYGSLYDYVVSINHSSLKEAL
jgi:hypothetical protein